MLPLASEPVNKRDRLLEQSKGGWNELFYFGCVEQADDRNTDNPGTGIPHCFVKYFGPDTDFIRGAIELQIRDEARGFAFVSAVGFSKTLGQNRFFMPYLGNMSHAIHKQNQGCEYQAASHNADTCSTAEREEVQRISTQGERTIVDHFLVFHAGNKRHGVKTSHGANDDQG